MPPSITIFLLHLLLLLSPASAFDFLFSSFNATAVNNNTDLILIQDARVESTAVRLTNDSNQFALGRVFYPQKLTMIRPGPTRLASFRTSFVFSVLPEISTSPGFGLCFVLSNSTSPPAAFASQYFGLFNNATVSTAGPLLAVEFDTGRNPEFDDPDGNHVGIDLNSIQSAKTNTAGYYDSVNGSFVAFNMRDGRNIHAWIDFNGENFEINVTVAPAGVTRPVRPTLTYRDPIIANYVSTEMYVGFSASKTTWVEAQRILAWSFSDTGVAREINTSNLPVFSQKSSSSSLSNGAIAGIVIGCAAFVGGIGLGFYLIWGKSTSKEEEEEEEDWASQFWPHRFSYEELQSATDGFSGGRLLGSGGFGKVYRGIISPNNNEIAVKCVNHDSKQGFREFMAEISSMGRLQHKNLVQLRGWCRKKNELMLIYDYMPNGSLNRWIFDSPRDPMAWNRRRMVLDDVAEGLNYLHHGWGQVVIHRDIKSSNILLDSDMRARLGDFGLAKLYEHGGAPNTTRVVGTLGYLAPELATAAAPTPASDVYGFGVVVMEVVCGRRPIEFGVAVAEGEEEEEEEAVVLVDWVREMYGMGRLGDAADRRMELAEEEAEEVEMLLKLGLVCCHPDPTKRPTMSDVVALLVGGQEASAASPVELLSRLSRAGTGSCDP